MRIRILVGQPAGAILNGQPWPAEGEETEVPTAQGAHLVASGVAEEVIDEAPRVRRRGRPREAAGE